jgi:hypothetical protein
MKLKKLTPRQYRKMVDDICDSMIEDELEMLTVCTSDLEIRGKKVFLVIITETDELDKNTINEIQQKFK